MKYSDIENAFLYVSMAPPDEHYAYFNKETGETLYVSEFGDSDELPDDFEENDKYISVPHKNDLNLAGNWSLTLCLSIFLMNMTGLEEFSAERELMPALKNCSNPKGNLRPGMNSNERLLKRLCMVGVKKTISVWRINKGTESIGQLRMKARKSSLDLPAHGRHMNRF